MKVVSIIGNTAKSLSVGVDKNGNRYAILNVFTNDLENRPERNEVWAFGNDAAYVVKRLIDTDITTLTIPDGKKTVNVPFNASSSVFVLGDSVTQSKMDAKNHLEIFTKVNLFKFVVLYTPQNGGVNGSTEPEQIEQAEAIPF